MRSTLLAKSTSVLRNEQGIRIFSLANLLAVKETLMNYFKIGAHCFIENLNNLKNLNREQALKSVDYKYNKQGRISTLFPRLATSCMEIHVISLS